MSPASPLSADSPAVRRKRGAKFWLIVIGAVLLASPMLLYLGAVLYVDMGFVTPGIQSSLSKLFDAPVDIGSVSTNWLRDLNIERITVKSADASQPLKLGNVRLDFDTAQLWRENRIRLATIDRPQFDLRRDESGKWNLGLKPPEKTSGGYRIEQTLIREGDFSIAWGSPAKSLKLMALNGNITDPGKNAPSAFTFYGVFDSLENITATGSAGPGAAWGARVFGGVNLERDLAGIVGTDGPSGHVTFEINGRRESLLLNTERGGPITFGGQVGLERFRYPFARTWAVVAPNRKLDLAGKIDIDGIPDAAAALNDIQLRVEGLGLLRGNGRVLKAPGTHLVLENVSGQLDMATLNEIFEPHLLPNSVKAAGALAISDFSYVIPMGEGAPPSSISAKLSATGARVAFSTLGELPACDVAGTLKWPALSGASLAIGDLGRIAFDMKDMSPNDPHFLLALADGTVIHDLHIDVGRFWESEVGRRVLTANFDLKQPVVAVTDLPYVFKGQLAGSELHLSIAPSVAKPERLTLNGLRLDGCSIARWPLPFKIPQKKFSGDLKVDSAMSGELVNKLTLQGALAETGAAGPAATHVEFEHTYFPSAEPAQRVGPVKIKQLVMALADLDQMFEIKKQYGVSATGVLQMSDASLNLQRMAADAALALDKCDLQIEVPSAMQSAIVSALKMSDHTLIASTLENYPIETIKLANLSAKLQIKIDGNRISVKGRTDELPIRIKMPSGVPLVGSLIGNSDYTAYTLPPADVAFEVELDEKNAPKIYRAEIAWAKQSRLALTLKPPEDVRDKAKSFWVAKGSLDVAAGGGLSLTFNVPVDPLRRQVGDVEVSIKSFDLALLAPQLKSSGVESLSGRMTDVDARLKAFSYAMPTIAKLANIEVNGNLANIAFSDAHAEFDRLSGKLRCVLNSAGDSISVNTLVKLDSYEALFAGGAFYLPPPSKGHGGDLHVVGTYTKKDNAAQILLNNCEMNLGDEVQLSAGGTLELSGTDVTGLNLNPLRITLPDMAKAVATFGAPNLKDRSPWFGDIGLSGRGAFDGALLWSATGKTELNGMVGLKRSTITLGTSAPFVLNSVSGDFPLVLSWSPEQSKAKVKVPEAKPYELRGKLNLGPLKFGALQARAQELAFIARPNHLLLDSPLELQTPLGNVTVASASYKNLLNFSSSEQPQIDFALSAKVDVAARLKDFGISLNGIENTTLSGPPLQCRIQRVLSKLGERQLEHWDLDTTGNFRAPFYGGEISVERLNARGLFGPAPSFGGDLFLRGPEGIRFKAFTDANQQLGALISGLPGKALGKLALRANLALTNFEAADLSVAGIKRFDLDVESLDFKDNEFWFDGELAMTLNYPLVRAAFPAIFSDDKIKALTFGIKKLAMKFSLSEDGWLTGPLATKLPDNMVLEGYGHESGISALLDMRLKQDVKAAVPPHRVPWKSIAAPFKKP